MTLVVDASALVAIGLREPEAVAFSQALLKDDDCLAAPINLVEAGIVLSGRWPDFTEEGYRSWLRQLNVSGAPVEHEPALAAYIRYGKGRHPARLNLGDCFAYALAMQLHAPLLFKGDDFALTDVKRAI